MDKLDHLNGYVIRSAAQINEFSETIIVLVNSNIFHCLYIN